MIVQSSAMAEPDPPSPWLLPGQGGRPPRAPSLRWPSPIRIVGGLALLFAVLFLFAGTFRQISSGYCGVLLDFGSVQPTALGPGLHVTVPFYQRIELVSTQPQTVTSDELGATHDLQTVHTSVSVTFHLNPADAPGFWRDFRDFDTFGRRIIAPTVSNDVKAVTAAYNAEELVTKRDIVDGQIKELVVRSLVPYHLNVEAVNIANFAFSHAYDQAIEAKQIAQQQALQAQYTLDQAKIVAQKQVVEAKAHAEAQIANAQGEAQALLVTSEAQSKANALISASLTPSLLQAKALDRWTGTMPQYLGAGAPLPFIGASPVR
jgi:regulator of protease activity HflC (stomatin/prohibitin superfamily)